MLRRRPLLSATAVDGGGAAAVAPSTSAAVPPPVVVPPPLPGSESAHVRTPPGVVAAPLSLIERAKSAFFGPQAAAEIGALRSEVATLQQQLLAAQSEIATLKPKAAERDQLEALLNQATTSARTVSQSTAETIATLGIPLSQVPPADGVADDGTQLAKTWSSLHGSAKTEFFRKHEAALTAYAQSQAAKN